MAPNEPDVRDQLANCFCLSREAELGTVALWAAVAVVVGVVLRRSEGAPSVRN
jgi:hypothetical protein